MTDIKFDILPQRSAVMAGHNTEVFALVRAQAPSRPIGGENDRMPLNLSLVLDRSGSMSGKPLEEAKRCAAYIVDQLDSRDRVSIVVYDNRVEVLVPSTQVTDKLGIKQLISGIHSGGSTNLHGGWEEGAKQCLIATSGEYLSRVLLLSDGCANVGLTEVDLIAQRCAKMVEAGVSTSTYGLGTHFNEELMVEMAKSGSGQSYYGESAEDLLDPFQEEFSLMSALCARQVKLTLSAPIGVFFTLLNDYRHLTDTTWQIPDLAYEGEAWALVRLSVSDDVPTNPSTGDIEILRAFLSYVDVESDASDTRSYTLRLPRIDASAWAAITADDRVTGRLQEIRVGQLQSQVREAALLQDWNRVDQLVAQAEEEAGDNAWVKEALQTLKRYARRRDRDRMSKEALYMSRKMSHRLAEHDEDYRSYSVSAESSKAEYLRKKREQGKRMDRPD
jgi:Ca-activated chloride channel family protein|tara:strand:- start:5406 stop:6743 length:1338 start_codon:yes stop_codon:yes gene_type:complete